MATADLKNVQGLVYNGYKKLPFAGYLFATLGADPVLNRAWLRSLTIASSLRDHMTRVEPKVAIAFAASGLRALGVPDGVIDDLPQELKDGMARRDRVLGDKPAEWTLGHDHRLDVILLIYAATEARRSEVLADHRARLVAAGAHVHADELACEFVEREHFGFADGLSQPFVPGVHDQPRAHEHPIALGEVLLGYENQYAKLPASPKWGSFDLGANGTYLVFRKLAQNVGALWTHLAQQAEKLGLEREAGAIWLGAKLVGRWPSGAPITLAPHQDDPKLAASNHANNFGYIAHDRDGLHCPIASHVRRANPRDARAEDPETSLIVVNRHRILRRGRSYGQPISIQQAIAGGDTTPRGLYFIGLNASIARGFEFIQQTWLNNPGFLGLGGEADPIVGPGGCPFTIPADPLHIRIDPLPRVVTTLGGGYFFLPSLAAIAHLATEPRLHTP
ncbi:MAG: Dyp-type peroxidase [Kofleriaceae bacterium]